jgi:GNAT superfamily N-acetyltransferase
MATLNQAQPQVLSNYNPEWGEWEVIIKLNGVVFHSSWVEICKEGEDDEDIPTGEVLLTGLESSRKGSGLGDKVLLQLKTWAKSQGFHTISLTPGGEHLEAFYRRGGWIPPDKEWGHWTCRL